MGFDENTIPNLGKSLDETDKIFLSVFFWVAVSLFLACLPGFY